MKVFKEVLDLHSNGIQILMFWLAILSAILCSLKDPQVRKWFGVKQALIIEVTIWEALSYFGFDLQFFKYASPCNFNS